MAQVVEYLSSKHKALSLNSSTPKKKKKKKKSNEIIGWTSFFKKSGIITLFQNKLHMYKN
jgi:hypothetical protein